MNAVKSNNTTSSNTQNLLSNRAFFFQKKDRGTFFSKSTKEDLSFFQPKLEVGQSGDKNGQTTTFVESRKPKQQPIIQAKGIANIQKNNSSSSLSPFKLRPLINQPRPRLSPITFNFFYDSATWTKSADAKISWLINVMKMMPSIQVILTGHTSIEGSESYNQVLSEKRANAIKNWLIMAGIAKSRIMSQGMGESFPIAIEADLPNSIYPSQEEIRNKNRRVDAFLYDLNGSFSPSLDLGNTNWPEAPENLKVTSKEKEGGKNDPIAKEPCKWGKSSTYFFEQLPSALQMVINQSAGKGEFCSKEDIHYPPSCFNRLDRSRKQELINIYNVLCQLSLWKHIRGIEKIVPGEKAIRLGRLTIKPPGLSVSVHFIVDDVQTMNKSLMQGGHFCLDYGIGASQHKGQSSFRKKGVSNFLHVSTSLRNSNQADAHLDKDQSVGSIGPGGLCVYDLPGSYRHIGRELVPEKVRNFSKKYSSLIRFALYSIYLGYKIDTGILEDLTLKDYALIGGITGLSELPGFQLNPDISSIGQQMGKNQPYFSIGIDLPFEINGANNTNNRLGNRVSRETPPPDERSLGVLEKVKKEMRNQNIQPNALTIQGVGREENIDSEIVAGVLIQKMQLAEQQAASYIEFLLKETYAKTHAERDYITANFKKIALIVGKYYPEISGIWLHFDRIRSYKDMEKTKNLRRYINLK